MTFDLTQDGVMVLMIWAVAIVTILFIWHALVGGHRDD